MLTEINYLDATLKANDRQAYMSVAGTYETVIIDVITVDHLFDIADETGLTVYSKPYDSTDDENNTVVLSLG